MCFEPIGTESVHSLDKPFAHAMANSHRPIAAERDFTLPRLPGQSEFSGFFEADGTVTTQRVCLTGNARSTTDPTVQPRASANWFSSRVWTSTSWP